MPWGGLLQIVLKCSVFRGYQKLFVFLSPLYTLLLPPGQRWSKMAVVQRKACLVALAPSFLDGYIISLGAILGSMTWSWWCWGLVEKAVPICCLFPGRQPVTPANPVSTEEVASSQELLEQVWSKPWLYCAQLAYLFCNQLHKKKKKQFYSIKTPVCIKSITVQHL